MPVLCAPATFNPVLSLDNILVRFHPIWKRSMKLLDQDSLAGQAAADLMRDALAMAADFATWPSGQIEAWTPSRLPQTLIQSVPGLDLPDQADEYFDVYVAAVWNTYRKTQLRENDN
ncbi:hypothetical protein PRZ48_000850 [Zasmidium cellare]|uniref:Uncharacterized protein n=1 Tax=Zasmidium cellare TaxID=395010 RepID=A0ABR0F155_ZASCE|nr:hypothetical protein PRZ48_000850 [Zasmidium cellare]